MTTDCSLNYKFNTWKFQAQTWGEHIVYRNCFRHSEQFLYTTYPSHVLQKEELLTKYLPAHKWNMINNCPDNFRLEFVNSSDSVFLMYVLLNGKTVLFLLIRFFSFFRTQVSLKMATRKPSRDTEISFSVFFTWIRAKAFSPPSCGPPG